MCSSRNITLLLTFIVWSSNAHRSVPVIRRKHKNLHVSFPWGNETCFQVIQCLIRRFICSQLQRTSNKESYSNFLLTEREGRREEYWPEVLVEQTEWNEVLTITTKGRYSQERLEEARLVIINFFFWHKKWIKRVSFEFAGFREQISG